MNKSEVGELNTHNEDFTVSDPIEDRIASGFDWPSLGLVPDVWLTATDALIKVGVRDPTKGQTISAARALRKLNGGERRKTNGRVLFLAPEDLSEFEG